MTQNLAPVYWSFHYQNERSLQAQQMHQAQDTARSLHTAKLAHACAENLRDSSCAQVQPRNDAHLQSLSQLLLLLALCSIRVVQHQPSSVHGASKPPGVDRICHRLLLPGVSPKFACPTSGDVSARWASLCHSRMQPDCHAVILFRVSVTRVEPREQGGMMPSDALSKRVDAAGCRVTNCFRSPVPCIHKASACTSSHCGPACLALCLCLPPALRHSISRPTAPSHSAFASLLHQATQHSSPCCTKPLSIRLPAAPSHSARGRKRGHERLQAPLSMWPQSVLSSAGFSVPARRTEAPPSHAASPHSHLACALAGGQLAVPFESLQPAQQVLRVQHPPGRAVQLCDVRQLHL